MKNKSKLKKIREKKAGTSPTVTKEWLYMNPNSITVAEIENALDGIGWHRNRNLERGGSIRGGGSQSIIPWISRRLQSI